TVKGQQIRAFALVANQSDYAVGISATIAENVLRNIGTDTVVRIDIEYFATSTLISTHELLIPVLTEEALEAPTAADISVAASGFDGNLAATDDTVQKVAQKVDDLTVGGGGGGIEFIGSAMKTGNTEVTPVNTFVDLLEVGFTPATAQATYLIEFTGFVYSAGRGNEDDNQASFDLAANGARIPGRFDSFKTQSRGDDSQEFPVVGRRIFTPGETTKQTIKFRGFKGNSNSVIRVNNTVLTVMRVS
ncbi:MAG: hypothetical protein OXE50_15430, partial [Chloroflexi bacterium]|nr:hypothetical protein [Chloroflexota bacterium]